MINKLNLYEQKYKEQFGLIYAFLTSFSIFVQYLFVRHYRLYYGVGQITFVRSFAQLIYNYFLNFFSQDKLYPPKKLESIITIRNIIANIPIPVMFYSLTKLPLSICSLAAQITPIIVPMCDWLLYNTKYTLIELTLALLSVLGVLIITNQEAQQEQYVNGMEKVILILALFIGYTVAYSISSVLIKEFQQISILTINGQNAFIGIVLSIFVELYMLEQQNSSFSMFIQVFLVVGSAGTMISLFSTKAYQLGKPGRVTIINSSHIVIAFIIEYFTEDSQLGFFKIFGASLTTFCVVMTLILTKNI